MINLANKDFLTGLYNRRIFFEKSEEYISSIGNSETYGILMIDIDFFKRVNDSFGHDTGDVTLTAVAKSILESTRGADIVSRFGGEEFVVLLKKIDSEGLSRVAENIRNNVERCKIGVASTGGLSVTVSIGGCLNKVDIMASIKEADRLLYLSKDNGRNRVTIE
jgi:diguanylate cyclase (GGDEF)-like protein